MTATTPQSAKDKGRRFQKEITQALQNALALPEADVASRPMGSCGADIMLSERARHRCPFAIECKRAEHVKTIAAWQQAKANAEKERLHPCLIIRRNRMPAVVIFEIKVLKIEVHTKPLVFATHIPLSKIEKMIDEGETGVVPVKVMGAGSFAICGLPAFLKLLQDEGIVPANSPNSPPAEGGHA